jgi:hypothetical protein
LPVKTVQVTTIGVSKAEISMPIEDGACLIFHKSLSAPSGLIAR